MGKYFKINKIIWVHAAWIRVIRVILKTRYARISVTPMEVPSACNSCSKKKNKGFICFICFIPFFK